MALVKTSVATSPLYRGRLDFANRCSKSHYLWSTNPLRQVPTEALNLGASKSPQSLIRMKPSEACGKKHKVLVLRFLFTLAFSPSLPFFSSIFFPGMRSYAHPAWARKALLLKRQTLQGKEVEREREREKEKCHARKRE